MSERAARHLLVSALSSGADLHGKRACISIDKKSVVLARARRNLSSLLDTSLVQVQGVTKALVMLV